MTGYAFLGALALGVLAFELASALARAVSVFGDQRHNRLAGAYTADPKARPRPMRSTWEALLVNLLPGRFDPSRAKNSASVVALLRRAGWPYETPGDFYAYAVRTFSIYLGIGAVFAGVMVTSDMAAMAPVMAAAFVYLGLRRPYAQMQVQIKRRAEAMRNNMLIGLSVLTSLLNAGVGVQEALRRTSSVGGPFCNLLGLLVARMEMEDVGPALKLVRAHLPDPKDVEAVMFFRDVEAYFVSNRPLGPNVQALQQAVHRLVVEATEARAALVKQRAGLIGIAVIPRFRQQVIDIFNAAIDNIAAAAGG